MYVNSLQKIPELKELPSACLALCGFPVSSSFMGYITVLLAAVTTRPDLQEVTNNAVLVRPGFIFSQARISIGCLLLWGA